VNREWAEELGEEVEQASDERLPLVPSWRYLRELCQTGPPLARLLLASGIRWDEVPRLEEDGEGLRIRGGRRLPGRLAEVAREGFQEWLASTPLATRFAAIGRRLTPTVFRHAFAVAALEGGVDLLVLRQLMGHRDLRTTQNYIAVALRDCQKVYQQTHPLCARRKPQARLNVDQVLDLLAAIAKPRDALIARLGYASAMRADELVSFTPADLDPDQDRIFVRAGKGEQDRYVLTDAETMVRLRLHAQGRPLHERVFPTTRDQVWKIVKRAARAAGLDFPDATVSPHGLRHACASHCHQAGMPPELLARLLGHAVLRNTLLYVHVPWQRVMEELTRCRSLS
jgi:site-specific recombinase XerD